MEIVRTAPKYTACLFRARLWAGAVALAAAFLASAVSVDAQQSAGAPGAPPALSSSLPKKSKASPGKSSQGSFKIGTKPTPTPSPFPDVTPAPAKRGNAPFKSRVLSVDKAHGSFRVGKKKVRLIRVTADTKLFRGDGTTPAVFSDIVVGVEIRGSLRHADGGALEAVSLKIGLKKEPAPVSAGGEGDALP